MKSLPLSSKEFGDVVVVQNFECETKKLIDEAKNWLGVATRLQQIWVNGRD